MTKKAIAAIALCLALAGCANTTHTASDPRNAGRFECESGNVSIVTDTRTGVQYLLWSGYESGGVCVLVDRDGKPLTKGGE